MHETEPTRIATADLVEEAPSGDAGRRDRRGRCTIAGVTIVVHAAGADDGQRPTGSDLSFPSAVPLPTAVQAEVVDSNFYTSSTPGMASTTTIGTTTARGGGSTAPPGTATMDITSASVTCDGVIQVEYATAVGPGPSPVADHFVLFHPVGNPAAIDVAHVVGNVSNGTFVHERQGSAGETYRLIVVAVFDPARADGPAAMAQAETVATDGC